MKCRSRVIQLALDSCIIKSQQTCLGVEKCSSYLTKFCSARTLRLRCTVCSLIIHEQLLLFVSSATLIYALNMKVYCIPASQITSPCFPISSQRGRP